LQAFVRKEFLSWNKATEKQSRPFSLISKTIFYIICYIGALNRLIHAQAVIFISLSAFCL
jgi:hypothetical protein